MVFQSTLPVGGATVADHMGFPTKVISIHAPRGGSDSAGARRNFLRRNFNPRSPWGERPGYSTNERSFDLYFNPRSPWGERPSTIDLRNG